MISSDSPIPTGDFLTFLEPLDGTDDEDGLCSLTLGELWFPRVRGARSVLQHPAASGEFSFLEGLGRSVASALLEGEAVVEVEGEALFRSLRALRKALSERGRWPEQFFFGPVLKAGPVPVYASRKLRTGVMVAGFDLCWINRNWDGIERIEDLTSRDLFIDAEGEVAIVRRRLEVHLGEDLRSWCLWLARHRGERVALRWVRRGEDVDRLLAQVQARAERWRRHWGLPDYQPERLAFVAERWKDLLLQSRPSAKMAVDLGAYVGEMMRGLWGGFYRRLTATEREEEARARGATEALPEVVALALVLPFDCELRPLAKALRAFQQRKRMDWQLQLEVFAAQRRQRALLLALGEALYAEVPLRRLAALRLLAEIPDRRVDQMWMEWLAVAEEPNQIMWCLERLAKARLFPPWKLLQKLCMHPRDGVVARALWLLGLRHTPQLPRLLVQIFSEKQRPLLRPLARHLLTSFGRTKEEKRQAKEVLKSLGPIPPARTQAQLLPDPPEPLRTFPILSEILEDCDNPTRREAALRLLTLYPEREELETLGAGLADPDPEVRRAVIGLLSGRAEPEIQQLLQTRCFLENDPLCATLLREALHHLSTSKLS